MRLGVKVPLAGRVVMGMTPPVPCQVRGDGKNFVVAGSRSGKCRARCFRVSLGVIGADEDGMAVPAQRADTDMVITPPSGYRLGNGVHQVLPTRHIPKGRGDKLE